MLYACLTGSYLKVDKVSKVFTLILIFYFSKHPAEMVKAPQSQSTGDVAKHRPLEIFGVALTRLISAAHA